MTIAHPIGRAWLSAGGSVGRTTGSQNYDEFADDAEITAIIAENPASALALEMPHRAPDSVGQSFGEAVPAALRRVAAAKGDRPLLAYDDVAVVYGITATDGSTSYGLWCMVDTNEISGSAEEPGQVIRNEDVFIDKVRQRVSLVEYLGHLLSPVLLLATDRSEELHAALATTAREFGTPVLSDVDQAGRRHELWPGLTTPRRAELLSLAGRGELVVADGNHRSLAAQLAKLPRFLSVITTPESVTIEPYNRLVAAAPAVDELLTRLASAGAQVAPVPPLVTAP